MTLVSFQKFLTQSLLCPFHLIHCQAQLLRTYTVWNLPFLLIPIASILILILSSLSLLDYGHLTSLFANDLFVYQTFLYTSPKCPKV